MKLTIRFLTTILLVIVGLTTSFATNAVTQEDVVTFTIPKGYRNSLYGLCRDINMPIDTIIKYNPLLEHGLSIGASISLPANYVDRELLIQQGLTPFTAENNSSSDKLYCHPNSQNEKIKNSRGEDSSYMDKQDKQLASSNTNNSKTTKTTPVKQIVEGYYFNGSMFNSITKCKLHLEDDYVIGGIESGTYKPFNRKHKVKVNPSSDPSKVGHDLMSTVGGVYTHKYLDYYINTGVEIYFNLITPIEITEEESGGISAVYKPTIVTDASFPDPYRSDDAHMLMTIKVKGDRIIAYKDPFTKRFVDCNIPYYKNIEQSFKYYYEYTANVGKLVVSFLLPKDAEIVYQENDVDIKPELDLKNAFDEFYSKHHESNPNPNPLEYLELSYIIGADCVISDVKVIKSPDHSLDEDAIRSLRRVNIIKPAKREGHPVNMQGTLALKFRKKMTLAQKFKLCKKFFDDYFSDNHRQENIQYSKHYLKQYAKFESPLSSEAPDAVKKLAKFVTEFRPSVLLNTKQCEVEANGYSRAFKTIVYSHLYIPLYYDSKKVANKIVKNFNGIMDDLFTSKHGTSNIYWQKNNGQKYYLKYEEYADFIQCQLNELNDKIYYYIVDFNLDKAKIGDYNLPTSFYELSRIFSKEVSDEEFDKFWSKSKKDLYNVDLNIFSKNPKYRDSIEQWKKDFYYNELGKNRNAIFYQNSNIVRGYYPEFIEWSNEGIDREFIFDSVKPYMLYFLQKNGDGCIIWSETQCNKL